MYTYKLQQEHQSVQKQLRSFMILSVGGRKKESILKNVKNSIAIGVYGKKWISWIC